MIAVVITRAQRELWGHNSIAAHALYARHHLKAAGVPVTEGIWPLMVESGTLVITYDAMFEEHKYEWRQE